MDENPSTETWPKSDLPSRPRSSYPPQHNGLQCARTVAYFDEKGLDAIFESLVMLDCFVLDAAPWL